MRANPGRKQWAVGRTPLRLAFILCFATQPGESALWDSQADLQGVGAQLVAHVSHMLSRQSKVLTRSSWGGMKGQRSWDPRRPGGDGLGQQQGRQCPAQCNIRKAGETSHSSRQSAKDPGEHWDNTNHSRATWRAGSCPSNQSRTAYELLEGFVMAKQRRWVRSPRLTDLNPVGTEKWLF